MATYATFWAGGAPSPFERACLASFALRGCPVTVYSYEPIRDLPEGVATADAGEVAPVEASRRFIYGGRANLSHFSDYFRYRLFQRTPHVWIDADMLLLRPLDFRPDPSLVARERADSICGAIMRLGPGPALDDLVRRTEAAMDRELSWGETGPKLLTAALGRDAVFAGSRPPRDFFPIGHDEFWKVFMPAERDWCEEAVGGSYGVHLWNNVVDNLGVWKRLAPPDGSWLAARYAADGTLGMFDASYPADVMGRMIANWHLRKTGGDLGVKSVVRQLVPSVARTLRHHVRR